MLKISNIQFVRDQENVVKAYRVAFDGESENIQMLSGSLELSSEEIDLSNISKIVENKLALTLQQ